MSFTDTRTFKINLGRNWQLQQLHAVKPEVHGGSDFLPNLRRLARTPA
jgi:hypothetical protein